MPRRPAKITQADIARAIRAAKEAGASGITLDGEGVIRIALGPNATPTETKETVEPAKDESETWTPSALSRSFSRRGALRTIGTMRIDLTLTGSGTYCWISGSYATSPP